MARLIPRKQIEEQQDISGSLRITGDLIVTGSSLFSGSLQTDGNFFLGNELSDRGEITGSVFLTGSLTIDGRLETTSPDTILAVTASNALLAVDTERYAGVLAKDFGANVPTLYVSSTDGDDTNDGRSIQYPLRTIKRAAELAQPGYDGRYGFDTGSIYNGYVIKVQAGTYLEDNPVILPSNTTVWGAGLRITKINAQNPTEDLFWVNSGCYIAEVTMGGLRLYPDQINPEKGFGVAFQPGAFITTSPYVQNCSQISNQENSFTELYEDIPPGGGGLYVNGDAVDPDSPLASMVLDAYTQISPNGVGCLVNGRGFIQLVSFFNNFSYYAIRVNNGGHATLNNSNISFGLYGMYASGSRFISGSTGGNVDARDKARASYSIIVDTLNKGLENGLPDVTVLNTDAGIKVTDELQYIKSDVSYDTEAEEVKADYSLVSAIVENGNSNFPTLLARSSTKGYGFDSPYNILGAQQTTSSVVASDADVAQISSSFGTILGIFANGTGSYNFTSSAQSAIKVTELTNIPTSVSSDFITGSVSSSFGTVLNVLNNGLSSVGSVVSNNSASIAVTLDINTPFTTGISSSLEVRNSVSASFSTIYNIVANGTGSTILDIPENHQREYVIRKNDSNTAYVFALTGSGNVENATLTLYRGETYKFFVSAGLGPDAEPFYIRKSPTIGFDYQEVYDYEKGVINNGDSNGVITFKVPYDAPNKLYYISQDTLSFNGVFNIINNSQTPRELIASTLTYPATIASSSIASGDTDKINAYDLLINNLDFIKDETIAFVSSSWSSFSYDESTCRRDIGYIVDGVAKDILYGGNEESIRSGLYYYLYPSNATTTELGPTLTAIKYVSGMVSTILQNKEFVEPNIDRDTAASAIFDNREFIQNEVIAFLSSSWSEFQYNEASCSRDVGYILDAVSTDLRYEGTARAVEAGQYYYLYPSQATGNQLNQTSDGVRYAAGLAKNVILNKTFSQPNSSTLAAYNNLRDNKALIQDETIEFINVAYPTLEYNQTKCRRDVGYIIDAIATDLLYSSNERSVTAGRFYYDYPSIATTTQKTETAGGIRYAKIISEYIVKNIILDTPRIVTNDERLIKVTSEENVLGLTSGTDVESANISSSFAIIEGIIKRGTSAIPSLVAQNTDLNWGISSPLNVTTDNQVTNSFVNPSLVQTIESNWGIITSIIGSGTSATPEFTSSVDAYIKVTNGTQTTGTSVSNSVTGSISSSFSYVANIVSGGVGVLDTFVPNTQNNIKVTSTTFISGDAGDNSITSSISSSVQSIVDIITNGLSSIQPLTSSLNGNIKVGGVDQYISSSASGSLEDVSSISSSISLVTQIIERGESAVVAKTPYTTPSTNESVLAAYEILKQNIDFIQEETIQYLSSSWSGFDYNEAKCRRDVGLIISGAAEDLIWNSNSASIVNGQFYYEYPSQATGSQLAQTLDGINYASRLAQKLIQNVEFQQLNGSALSASILITNNKDFIQDETIQYLSSSWSDFQYDDVKCRRDVGYILDAAITDLKYGGNERSRVAGEYYFLFPSDATGSQLIQTTDGINYASRLAQKIAVGETFTSADSEKVEASRLLKANADLIANEVVEYVSSSWSGVQYNETKCKRDVKYILDAVRTDLVYGGNERTSVAGDFYYRYPSAATVAGVPSSTQQLDPTITGINYANRLAGVIVKSLELSNPSTSITQAAELIRENRSLIQNNTIEYVSDTYPSLRYDVGRCRRDTGFIVDAVVTDLIYGGNERSITAGAFYYLFPSQATDSQETETINALNFARDLAKLIALGGKAIEDSFDNVANIIQSGSAGIPTLVENTVGGIKATSTTQYTQTTSTNTSDKQIVSASFANVVTIINNGTGSIPTIVESSDRGVLRIGGTQITSSITPDSSEVTKVSSSFDVVLDIVENGLGSLPSLVRNSEGGIKVTSTPQYVSASSATSTEATLISASISIVSDIITNGTGSVELELSLPTSSYTTTTTDNNKFIASNILKENISFIQDETIAYLSSSWSTASYDEAKCRRDVGLILSASAEDLIWNSNSASLVAAKFYWEYPSQAQGAQLNQTLDGIRYAGELAQKVVVGTTLVSPSTSKLTAYNLLLDNKRWIQNQTIASINANLSTVSYNETTCKRDVGYILDAVATDILYGGNQRTSDAGRFYYLYPSAATGSQLDQTLEGIGYAKDFAYNIVNNQLVYTQITSSVEINNFEKNKVGSGFDVVIDIVTNGTGSTPTLELNTSGSIKVTDSTQFSTTASIATALVNNTTSSFDIVLDIVANGTGSTPSLVKNSNGLFKVTDTTQYTSATSVSKSVADYVSSSFNTIINILENGTGSLPTLVDNTLYNRKVTNTTQFTGSFSGSLEDIQFISESISIVTNIIANGIGSAPTIEAYTSSISSSNTLAAYEILKQNIDFIQNETIAYLSSSWSTASYDEAKCKRDISLIISGAAEDLIWNADSASIVNGVFYFESASQATGAQLNQTLDGLFYASKLAQKLVQNIEFTSPSAQTNTAYDLLVNNKLFVQNEVIEYISSSWSTKQYDEVTCKRDVGYIIDAVATDLRYGGNERAYKAGLYYYLYPSAATGSQIRETVTGVTYAKNLSDRILRGGVFAKVPHNRKEARELIVSNKSFIQNEVIAYVSASWNGFEYVEDTCKRDVGFILDAVATDLVYGGNERSIEAGDFYFRYPSTATSTQLGPTLSGIRYAKNLTKEILNGTEFALPSDSVQVAYNLLLQNKSLIQTETIGFVNSAWSFFDYNEAKCRRDVGYIVDAVATDILYGGNERVIEAGTYYYLYPSLATVDGDGDSAGQLGQTLDGVRYAKGISEKIVQSVLLQNPTPSEKAGYELLIDNKPLIQNEVIAFLSSSWSGVDGFSYNEASCSRDVAYIVDNVATDLIYGGNERSSKAGEYYFLYPSAATVSGFANPAAQLDQTTTGVRYAAGVVQKVIGNELLVPASDSIISMVELMRENKQFIQNETIQFIDAFYPYLTYNREKCRRDVGYIVDAVSTDLLYGGNERGIVAGDYYFRFPSKATTREQVVETVAGVEYAKAVAKAIVQNTLLERPSVTNNTSSNIKASTKTQFTSSIEVDSTEVNKVSSSFSIVTDIISGGVGASPERVLNSDGAIRVSELEPTTSSINGGDEYADLVTSSFNLVRDIIYYGEFGTPDALARNYDYGFELNTPSLLHISSQTQILGTGSYDLTEQTSSISSSFATIIDIVNNGLDSLPILVENTTSSIKVTNDSPITSSNLASNWDLEKVGNSFGIILNIIENGTSVIPTLVSNTSASIKVTETPQIISGSGADRLQGRLISASFGLVIDTLLNDGTSSVAYKAPNSTPNTNPKITSAYNLLLDNKSFIQSETIAFVSSSWSGFVYNEASCSRDVGLIIDGAAYDLLYGGNSASLTNGKYYFDFPSAATGSQLDQTITAIRFASGIAEKVVKNTKLEHISASLETSASFEMLIANKEFIKNESIAYISSSWSEFSYNETTCKRDIGYIVDAIATDLIYGGNERSIVAGDYYYRIPSNATTSELEPTLTGVRYAKGLAMNIISGSLLESPSDVNQYSYDLLLDNKLFIQSESVAFVNSKYPTLIYDEAKCKRDVGYIVDAVATDLLYGGNQRASKAGEFYYLYPSLATNTQLVETIAAIDYARRMSEEVVQSSVITTPQIVSNTYNNIKVTDTPQYVSASSATQIEVTKVSSSFGVVLDVVSNGVGSLPELDSNITEAIKVTNGVQYTSAVSGSGVEGAIISSSVRLINDIINSNGNINYALAVNNDNFNNLTPTHTSNETQITGSFVGDTTYEKDLVSSSFGIVNDIISDGLSSIPTLVNNASSSYATTTTGIFSSSFVGTSAESDIVTSSFDIVIDIIENQNYPTLVTNASSRINTSGTSIVSQLVSASASEISNVSSSFSNVINIITNGISAIPFVSSSTDNLIKVTSVPQYISGSRATVIENYKLNNSIETVTDIITNGLGVVPTMVKNTTGNIKVTSTSLVGGTSATTTESSSVSSSIVTIVDIITNGLGVVPTITENIESLIKVTDTLQYVSSSASASSAETTLISESISLISDIVYYGTGSIPTITKNSVGNIKVTNTSLVPSAYASGTESSSISSSISSIVDIITNGVGSAPSLVENTAGNIKVSSANQYISSSYSGSLEDVEFISSSISIITKIIEFGSSSYTTAGNYVTRLETENSIAAYEILKNNIEFIKDETIAYLSSSWTTGSYDESKCRRDVGLIVSGAAEDLIWNIDSASIVNGKFYLEYPSQAETSQLFQTLDGINYASRLAQKLVQNIVYVSPSSNATNASTLLLSNKEFIQNETIAYMSSSWGEFSYSESLCRRDISHIVDAVRTDLVYGGNERSRQAGLFYYSIPSLATTTQLNQTTDAVNYASELAQKIVVGESFTSVDSDKLTASELIRLNKNFIADEVVAYVSSSWGGAEYVEATCKRDVKYILDAVRTDLVYGGNERSSIAGEFYYRYPSAATVAGVPSATAQLDPTYTGILYSNKLAQKIVLNETFVTQSSDKLNADSLLKNNKQFIQNETIAYLSSSWGEFSYNDVSCSRDIGFIIDAVRTDIVYGGNERSVIAGEYYYKFPSQATGSQLFQTVDGINYASTLAQKIVVGESFSQANSTNLLASNLIAENKNFIASETIAYISSSWSMFPYNQSKCERDVKYILDAVRTDLVYGGNQRSIIAGEFYYLYPSLATVSNDGDTGGQLNQTLDGINYAKGLMNNVVLNKTMVSPSANVSGSYNLLFGNKEFLQNQTIAYISSSWTVDDNSESQYIYNEASCSRDVAYIVDAVATDLLYGGNQRTSKAGEYYYLYPSAATGSQLNQTVEAIKYVAGLSNELIQNNSFTSPTTDVSASYALLRNNKDFIANEVINYISSSWSEHSYIESKCRRDVGYIIDAVSTDLLYGGNERSSLAGEYYYRFPSNATTSELAPTLTGIKYAKHLAERIIKGETTFTNGLESTSVIYNLLLDNKSFIKAETINFVNGRYPNNYYSQTKCARDIGYIVDAVATDLLYGGNERVSEAGRYYYLYPSLATSTQSEETTTAILYAAGMVSDILTNTILGRPSIIENISGNIKATNTPQYITGSEIGTSYEASLISSSISIVTNIVENGVGVAGTPVNYTSPSTASNVWYAYNLLKENIGFIQNETIAYISSSWSTASYDESKCKRDVSLIISGAAEDMLFGVDSASIVNGKFYFESASQATDSQLNFTLDGIFFASKMAQKIVQNVEFSLPSTSVSASYALLRDNKQFIQSESIAFISSSWSSKEYSEETCKRDIGYIIDNVSTDLWYGGNERSVKAGEYYFLYPSQATSQQLSETTTGIKYAGDIASKVAQSIEFVTASSDRQVAWDLLRRNTPFIQNETIAYISSSWVTGSYSDEAFYYNEASCSRDVKYIVDGIATDILYGGNERTIDSAYFYYKYPSQATGSQLDETLEGIKYAGQLAEKVIVNTLFVTASATASAVYETLKANKSFIQEETIAYVTSSWVGLDYSEAKCRRDVGYIIDAVATDILYGGNQRSATAGEYYYKYPSKATGAQIDSTINAIDFAGGTSKNVITNVTFVTASQSVSASVELLRNNRDFIQTETMAWLDSAWSFFNYNKDKCRRDVGYIIDGVATDILYGGNERSVMSGEFYFKYPSKATLLGDGDSAGQLGQTLDGILYASRISQKVVENTLLQTASLEVSASFDLLRKNKTFIAAETIAYVSSSWSGVYYNEASCSRDVKYLIDAAATDLYYGGQERTTTAGDYYYRFPSNATKAGVPSEQNQLDPTITGVRYAGRLSSKVIQNPTYLSPSASVLVADELLIGNKTFIQKETITFLSSSWSTLQYNEVSCSRDVGFIIDAVRTDLKYGGNERSIEAGSYYYRIPSVAIQPSYTDNGNVGQKIQTVDGINYAKGLSEKIVKQTQLVYPTTKTRESAARLIAAKDELKQRAIGYTNGAFPYLVYNEASCSRDTGLIVDAIVTDLVYGGNERSIAAASSYYNGVYGSAAAVVTSQRTETLETNRYLRTRVEFIAQGAPLEDFGSLIVATGIDYSYNGAGVTFKALPPNQGGSGVADPTYEITELGGGRIYFTSGNQDGDFRIGTGLSINQATGTLVGRTFSKSLFSLVTPFSLALEA